MSLSTATIIQTTWRCPLKVGDSSEFKISFESTDGSWVSFLINGNTGIISTIENFKPSRQIPFWYTDSPFTSWRISVGQLSIVLNGPTVVSHNWDQQSATLQDVLKIFTPSRVCALWSGKLGYQIIVP